jgi:LuxR family maltose regulon positive regulatory protein
MPTPPATDVLLPLSPRRVVPRPDLEHRLDEVRPGGLAMIVASAGSGKSVLVRQWIAGGPHLRVASLSLTLRHADPALLARDLVGALRAVTPQLVAVDAIDERLPPGEAGLGADFVDALLGGLAATDGDVVLVLEDAHVLSGQAVLDDLGQLVLALPDNARAVVSTRRDLPWQLHRLRLEDKVVELRGADLAFRDDEARALVENVSQRVLTPSLIRRVVLRTDGWAAGLQLAAISLRTAPDPDAFVESFAGSDRLVVEYLLDEVIERQDPETRRFLLHTSVLGWLSAEYCDAVTGAGNGHRMLVDLYRQSMFLIPDPSGETYRYHHLFAETLRYRLQIEDPDAVFALQQRAARWLIRHGREEEAVTHLLEAGDTAGALRVIGTVGHRLFEAGEASTLVRWLGDAEDLTGEGLSAGTEVNLLAAQMGADAATDAMETYRRLMRRRDLTLGELTAANALYSLLVFRGLPTETVEQVTNQVRDAIPRLGQDDVVDFLGIGGRDSVEAVARYTAAIAHFYAGDVERAATGLEDARTLPGMTYPLWHVYVLGSLALIRAWQGRCTEALGLARSSVDEAESFGVGSHHATAHAHLALAWVHLDRMELDAAERDLGQARLRLQGREASTTYFDLLSAAQARLVAAQEGPLEALALLDRPPVSSSEAIVLREVRRALRVRMLLGAGDVTGARALLDAAPGGSHDGGGCPVLAAVRVDVALAAGDLAGARHALDDWQPPQEDLGALVRRMLREFSVLGAEGDHHGAEAALTWAVGVALGERLRWPFVEIPDALRGLRRGMVKGSWLTDDRLWETALRLEPRLRARESLLDPLTERELDVLAYLPGRMRNQDIAADMFLTVNTVKTHLAGIYRKLGVTQRNEAVARAQEIGLL